MNIEQIPEGYMENSKGNLELIATIKPERLLEDTLVKDLVSRAGDMSTLLASFKTFGFEEVLAFRDLLLEKYNVKKGGAKGNMTFTSFDGTMRVEVSIAETIGFGPELDAAKALLNQYLIEETENVSDALKTLVLSVFQVNKKGSLDTKRILELRRYAIDKPLWNRAMEAISDAIRIEGSKTYIRIHQADAQGELHMIPLNLATV